LCRKIRESKRPEYCYFILQTAHAQKEDLLDSLDFGVDDYLSKPFDSNDLKLRLKIADKVLKLQAYAQSFMKAASNCPVCNENHETLSPHLPQSA
jgi:DNA-binding response OmpR family regulator